jgi:DNA-binding NtrC family response regulator
MKLHGHFLDLGLNTYSLCNLSSNHRSRALTLMPSTAQTSAAVRPREWILVVDDEASMLELLKGGLESDQLEVVSASNGQSALRMLAERATDPLLVMMDVLMPGGVDGLTLARKLQDRLRRTKIALMSGHLNDDSWWPADLREVAFLAKPFRMAQVAELVEGARIEFRGIT